MKKCTYLKIIISFYLSGTDTTSENTYQSVSHEISPCERISFLETY